VSVFAPGYAGWYDTLYREKDYAGECRFLEGVFSRRPNPPATLIDLGCGTGGHAILLARRGYKVTALDRSDAMLQAARRKAAESGAVVDFRQEDIRRLGGHEAFDAAIAMFAVIGYLSGAGEVEDFLAGVWRSLAPGGLLVFDGWHGPGVLRERPSPRLLEIALEGDETLLRLATPKLDVQEQAVEVHYRLWRKRGAETVVEGEERHRVRFFFPQELRLLLRRAGFVNVELHPFCSLERRLGEGDWHFTALAEKGKKP
jgi:SAM-dependent methyltransferase